MTLSHIPPHKALTAEAVWGTTQDTMTMIGIKRTKLNSLMKDDPTFPKPIRLSQNHIRWNLSEIREWIAAQEAKRG
ncbi:TPA: helix-turn-helix transcriptional regulator [Mannheimia haemolytica]